MTTRWSLLKNWQNVGLHHLITQSWNWHQIHFLLTWADCQTVAAAQNVLFVMKGLLCVLFVICTPSASCLQFSTFSLNGAFVTRGSYRRDCLCITIFAPIICLITEYGMANGHDFKWQCKRFYKVLEGCCGWIFSKWKINRSLENLLTLFWEIYCCGPGVCARDTCLNFVSLFLHESINWTESPQQLILFSLFVFAPVFPAATCAA